MAKIFKKTQFWGGLVGLALLIYFVKDIRPDEIRELWERLNAWYLLLSVLAAFVFVILRGLRWKLMVGQAYVIRKTQAVTLYAAGMVLNATMPALTGQVGRLFLFSRKVGLRKTFVFSTIVLEVLFDAISLLVFIFFVSLVFPFPGEYRFVGYIISGVTVGGVLILYLILHFQSRLERLSERKLRDRWPGTYITIKKFIRSFVKGIEMLRSSQHFIGSLLYSLAAWTTHIAAIYFLFQAFGLEVPFTGAAMVMIVNTILLMVPIAPGNAGTFELAVTLSLAAFGVSRSDAVLFALALHLIDVLPMFVLGAWYFRVERLSLRDLRKEHEKDVVFEHISEEGSFIEEEETA